MLEKYLPYFDIGETNHDNYSRQGELMWGMAKLNHEDAALKDEIESVLNQNNVRFLDSTSFYFILDENDFREIIRDSMMEKGGLQVNSFQFLRLGGLYADFR